MYFITNLKRVLTALLLFSISFHATGKLNVVATTTSMGMLAKEVGGENIQLKILAAPDRDAHYLHAKPSMMLSLRKADLVIAVGSGLEVGWLPSAVNNSANPKVLPGQQGFFEAASHTTLIDKGVADRSHGDVHPEGNPHFNLDPNRMADIAVHLAKRMGELDPENAQRYTKNSQKLAEQLRELVTMLKQKTQGSHGALMMHKDGNYLLELLSLPVLGFMEPVPGLPPTAAHIKMLANELQGKQGVIIHAPFSPSSGPKKLAKELGWQRVEIPREPAKSATFKDYQQLLLQWADALASQ